MFQVPTRRWSTPLKHDLGLDVEAGQILLILEGVSAELLQKPTGSSAAPIPVARASYRLAEWAVRMLPVDCRGEYRELFRSELFDLAQDGCGRWAQVRHCLRVLVRAPMLRRELQAPQRERSW